MKTFFQAPFLVAVLLAGCATTPQGRPDLLTFLQEGVTLKQDVLSRLGEPNLRFDREKILTYDLAQDSGGYFLHDQCACASKRGWPVWGHAQSLVLVFNEQDVLRRHSVVDLMKEDDE